MPLEIYGTPCRQPIQAGNLGLTGFRTYSNKGSSGSGLTHEIAVEEVQPIAGLTHEIGLEELLHVAVVLGGLLAFAP